MHCLALGMLTAIRKSLELIGMRKGYRFEMQDIPPEVSITDDLRRKAWRRRCLARLTEILPDAPRERLERIAIEMALSDSWLSLQPETAAFRLQAQQAFPIAVGLAAATGQPRIPELSDRR